MDIYRYDSYHDVLKVWMLEQPNQGRGLSSKIARHLNISTVLVSQILSGTRLLQMDYAFQLAKFIGFTEQETEYFLLLIQYARAGTETYKTFILKQIKLLQKEQLEIKNHVAQDINLSEQDKAQFYSHWHYSAVRLTADIPDYNTAARISESLSIPVARVNEILEFLVRCKLCVLQNGKYKMAAQNTHLAAGSPWIYSRQLQWRQKAIQAMEMTSDRNMFYTGPMVLSKKDTLWVRDQLIDLISKINSRLKDSPSEELMCLNIDWFPVKTNFDLSGSR